MSSRFQSALDEVSEIGRECTNQQLIEAIQKLPLIWDKRNSNYMSSVKPNFWSKLGGSPAAGVALKTRWERLKKAYTRDRKKYSPSGSGGGPIVTPFPEYALLTFLDSVVDDTDSRIDSAVLLKEHTDHSQRTDSAMSLDDNEDILLEEPKVMVDNRNPLKRARRVQADDGLSEITDMIRKVIETPHGTLAENSGNNTQKYPALMMMFTIYYKNASLV